MATQFAHAVVTTAGSALIAQATASNRIVLVGALSSASAASTDSELAGYDRTWYTGQTGWIYSASADGTTARIMAIFRNTSGTPQALKSAAILARLSSQTDADAVVLCALSDESSGIEIGGDSNVSRNIWIGFDLNLQAAGTVQAVSASAAAPGDLARFVSMWKAGDTGTGEAQSILGAKMFVDGITAGGIAISENGASVDGFGLSVSQIAGDYTLIATIRNAGGIANAFSIANGPGNTLITTIEGNIGVNGGLSCGALSASGEVKCLGRNLYLSNGVPSSNGYTLLRSGTATTPGFSVSVKGPSDNDETPLVSASYYNGVASVTVPNFTSGGYASIKGWMEVYQSALFKDSVHVIGNLQVDGTLVNASLWGSGAGALVVAHVTVTTGAQISDYINISRGQQIFNGQGWTGEGGASITLGVTADGYTVGTATRLRTLAPISVSSPSAGGTGSAVEVLAVVEVA